MISVKCAATIAAIAASLFSAYSSANAAAPARKAVAHGREAILYFDPASTRIDYTLQGWPHVTHGTFRLARGEIRIDPATGKAEGAIVVSATSGDSGSQMRDAEMKDSILEVRNYPEITFTPERAEGEPATQGDFPAKLNGALTLHGSAHRIALDVEVQPEGDRFVATTHFAVPYVAWGLKNPSLLIFRCADTVYVDVRTTGRVVWVPGGAEGAPPAAQRSSSIRERLHKCSRSREQACLKFLPVSRVLPCNRGLMPFELGERPRRRRIRLRVVSSTRLIIARIAARSFNAVTASGD